MMDLPFSGPFTLAFGAHDDQQPPRIQEVEAREDPDEAAGNQEDLKECSVRGCRQTLPSDAAMKMCDTCRERHRGYATTKRQRRKMEKAALQTVHTAQGSGSHGEEPWREGDLGQPVEMLPVWTGTTGQNTVQNWGSDLHLSMGTSSYVMSSLSSSELAKALTLPEVPRATQAPVPIAAEPDVSHATQVVTIPEAESTLPTLPEPEAQPVGELSPTTAANDANARFCSVKGCKAVVSGDYEFKMCPPCRVRYQAYGITKRRKWKAERERFIAEMKKLRCSETPTAGAWENSSPEPPVDFGAAILSAEHAGESSNGAAAVLPARMCTVSHCHKILPGHYHYKRCEEHRLQNRHHSKLKRVREKVVKALGPESGFQTVPVPQAEEGEADEEEEYAPGLLSETGHMKLNTQNRPLSCITPECHNLLLLEKRWKHCDPCRLAEHRRKARLRKASQASSADAQDVSNTATPEPRDEFGALETIPCPPSGATAPCAETSETVLETSGERLSHQAPAQPAEMTSSRGDGGCGSVASEAVPTLSQSVSGVDQQRASNNQDCGTGGGRNVVTAPPFEAGTAVDFTPTRYFEIPTALPRERDEQFINASPSDIAATIPPPSRSSGPASVSNSGSSHGASGSGACQPSNLSSAPRIDTLRIREYRPPGTGGVDGTGYTASAAAGGAQEEGYGHSTTTAKSKFRYYTGPPSSSGEGPPMGANRPWTIVTFSQERQEPPDAGKAEEHPHVSSLSDGSVEITDGSLVRSTTATTKRKVAALSEHVLEGDPTSVALPTNAARHPPPSTAQNPQLIPAHSSSSFPNPYFSHPQYATQYSYVPIPPYSIGPSPYSAGYGFRPSAPIYQGCSPPGGSTLGCAPTACPPGCTTPMPSTVPPHHHSIAPGGGPAVPLACCAQPPHCGAPGNGTSPGYASAMYGFGAYYGHGGYPGHASSAYYYPATAGYSPYHAPPVVGAASSMTYTSALRLPYPYTNYAPAALQVSAAASSSAVPSVVQRKRRKTGDKSLRVEQGAAVADQQLRTGPQLGEGEGEAAAQAQGTAQVDLATRASESAASMPASVADGEEDAQNEVPPLANMTDSIEVGLETENANSISGPTAATSQTALPKPVHQPCRGRKCRRSVNATSASKSAASGMGVLCKRCSTMVKRLQERRNARFKLVPFESLAGTRIVTIGLDKVSPGASSERTVE